MKPSNMAFQRARRPSLRSGRSLRSLGSPLNDYPLGDNLIDERIRIWNLLHDGELTAVSDEASKSVKIFVSIPYLRRRFAPLGDSVVIALSGVTLLELEYFDGEVSSLGRALEIGGPEILSTESQQMPITIKATLGHLRVAFESMDLAVDTGQPLGFKSVQQACEAYWPECKARSGEAT